MAAILKSTMAAPDVNSEIAKMFLDIENIGIDTRMMVLGALEQDYWQNYGHVGAILEINMAATRGRTFLGSIFFNDL